MCGELQVKGDAKRRLAATRTPLSCLQGIRVRSATAGLEPGAALSMGRDAGTLATCCPAPVQASPEPHLCLPCLSTRYHCCLAGQTERGHTGKWVTPWNSLGEAGDRPQEGNRTHGGKLPAVQMQPSFPPGDFRAFHVAISKQGVAWSTVASGCPIGLWLVAPPHLQLGA